MKNMVNMGGILEVSRNFILIHGLFLLFWKKIAGFRQ